MHRILYLFLIGLISCQNEIARTEKYVLYKKIDNEKTYILKIKGDKRRYSVSKELNIDIFTLADFSEFMSDKNKVYRKYDIENETVLLELEEVDVLSFEVYPNSVYCRDSKHVFDSRNGMIANADVSTFEPLKSNDKGVTAKDKNNYYFWNQIVKDTSGFAILFRKM
jgi:hypothetical protein